MKTKSAIHLILPAALLLAGSTHAAVIVPATDASFTPTGTLLAVTSTRPTATLGAVELNSPEFTASPSHGLPGNNATAWANFWSPNGTAKEDTRAVFTNNANATHTITFSNLDLPDGSIIHGIYVRWFAQSNQSDNVSYSFTEGSSSGSVTRNQMVAEVGPTISWTDAEDTTRTLGFDTLFSGQNIVVGGNDGFTLNIARVSGNNVIRTDTVILDVTIIPEPSAALLGGLGLLVLLRRRR